MPVVRLAPYRTIALEIAARLAAERGSDPLAPWPADVLVPSRGMAEAIAEALLEHFPHGIAALRLQRIDELAARILNANGQFPRVASDAERRLAMRMAVRAVDHPLMESRGVATMLERSYRDVRDGGVTLAELQSRIKSTRALRNARRTDAIVRAWTEYERLISQLRAIDPADLLMSATRLLASGARVPRQLVAGFYDMTGAQLALVRGIAGSHIDVDVYIPTDAAFAQPFLRAFDVHETMPPRPQPHTRATKYDTPYDELRDVCAQIAELLANGTPPHAIGIVARSLEPYDARLIQRLAKDHGFTTTIAEETPLIAHRLGRGAVTLLKLRERGFPRADVLELVRDGLHIETQLDVDAVDAATRKARIAGGTSDELRAIARRTRELDDYITLVAELETLTASLDLASLGSLFRIETESDLAAAQKLDDVAALFRRAAIWTRGIDAAAAIDAIEHETLRTSTRNGIWAGDVMRFRGRSFEHLFVVRMQDDVFPQRRTEDPLLPDADRRTLGLRLIGDGRDEEALLFGLVHDAANDLHFSFAAGDGFGKVLRPSRYLRGIANETRPRTSVAHSERASERQLQLLAKAGTRSSFDGYVPPPPPLAALSPTQLEDFGECPHKFLLKHILGVEDIDHPERELQIHHREKGIVDHRILERFYRATPPAEIADAAASLPQLPRAFVERLDGVVDAQFDEIDRTTPPFNRAIRDIERRATKRILRQFLTYDLADLDAQGLVPRWFEYKFGGKHRERADRTEAFVVETGGAPLRVEGTIDRIDAADDGRFRIVDYKSGKALRHDNLATKIDRGVRLQLALYAMAVAEFFGADAKQVSGTIRPIAGNGKGKFGFALHEKRDGILETLAIFARAIAAGAFPAFPNEKDDQFNSCKYCPVNHSCRTKHDADERRALQPFHDPRTLLGGGAQEPS
ncbi:MAG: PD-(D/E)XK nuclease family protein [Acidobacteria bacterium]|nr:PD-(D/E)XK nuclease family protein [Acidobacteriota bacterium]MBV9477896.1 PD-(D/E)XK nuclease family protein [Acidobacteriota bacterium]